MAGLMQTIEYPLESLGDELIDDLSAVETLTVPAGAVYAFIQAQGENVRLRDSGQDPDASTGLLLTADGAPLWYTGDLTAVKLIAAEEGAAAFVSYYRPVRPNVV